jgi:hypothetical protein
LHLIIDPAQTLELMPMPFPRANQTAYILPLVGNLILAAAAMAAPKQIAEMTLHPQPSQSKALPDQQPLFGDHVASGDGSGSGVLSGKIAWDLYEDVSSPGHHPAYLHGFLERDGKRYPFEIIGLYTAESPDKRQWRITGAITFDDRHLLGMNQASLTGTFEAGTSTGHYTIWADGGR